MANHRLVRAVDDVGMHECRRQLPYKAAMAGTRLVVADRFFPSSKLCPACGVSHDRDVNAARNVRNLAVSSTVSACGETGSGRCLATVKPASMKQELGHVLFGYG
ncbi:MAG TPA: hypothetical protein VNL71_17075 [Chloroflexota bacterium]|nr:hypothetical protein [Chloroflexota bacterium]